MQWVRRTKTIRKDSDKHLLWLMLSAAIMIMLMWQCTHPESIATRLVHLKEHAIYFLPLELKLPFRCFGIILRFSTLFVYGTFLFELVYFNFVKVIEKNHTWIKC